MIYLEGNYDEHEFKQFGLFSFCHGFLIAVTDICMPIPQGHAPAIIEQARVFPPPSIPPHEGKGRSCQICHPRHHPVYPGDPVTRSPSG